MQKIPMDTIKSKFFTFESQEQKFIQRKEIIRCINCNEIPIIDFIQKKNNILVICPNHSNTCNYSTFLSNCSFKCPNCFQPENQEKMNNSNICPNCNLNGKILFTNKCQNHQKIFTHYCKICRNHLCEYCNQINNHNHQKIELKSLLLKDNDKKYIEKNIKEKELILNNLINYIDKIPNENKNKGKGNQLLNLLEEKKKELYIEKIILMNYIEYNNNYFALININKILNFELYNFNVSQKDINCIYSNNEIGCTLNFIRSYLQNGYKQVKKIENSFTIKNFKDNQNIFSIHTKNIKSIYALNESLIVSGSWDCFLKIYNIYTNSIIYSIDQKSMIFNLKKYPLILQKSVNNINNHGVLVCLYCEIVILNIQEKNSKILGHLTISKIKGFGNFIWTAIVFEPDKKIISGCLDNRLSAHKLLPNDKNSNDEIQYCLLQSNMNKEKETITALLQIDDNKFISSSSIDLNDNPSIKFWSFNHMEDKFLLEKAIYDIYCCQYPNSICKINKNLIGLALEYASLSGKIGGIAIVDCRYKEIINIINIYSISCISSISENRFFTCGYDKNLKKRFIKEYMFNNELKEIGALEIFHYDDLINIEIIKESDLMVIGSDEGKITILDNYSICEKANQK